MLISFLGQIIAMIIVFPTRMIFVKTLGTDYLGINGLFTNIISVFSLADLGIGSAIVFSLYKPIAEKNFMKISALMNFYKNAYRIIGLIVLLSGLVVMPFLPRIMLDKPTIEYMYFIFLLFVLNSVVSYFYAYKRSIVIANQKNYIVNSIHYIALIAVNLIQMYVLVVTKNFILYLILQIVFSFLENIIISYIANKMFPFINKKESLGLEDKKNIYANVRAIMLHKFGSVVMLSTDNIVISSFIGVYWVGLYSNYYLITNALIAITNQVFNSVTASVGNLIVEEKKTKNQKVFNNLLFANFWLIGICSICLWQLINPFIDIWLGNKYLLNKSIVFLIVSNFYVLGMRNATLTFKSAAGLFRPDRYKPIVEAVLNVILSILLAREFGLAGVLLGTLISTLLTSFWIEPHIVYKHIFESSIMVYFRKYINYFLTVILTSSLTSLISNYLIIPNSVLSNIIRLLLSVIIFNVFIILLYKETDEYKYLCSIFLKLRKNKGN